MNSEEAIGVVRDELIDEGGLLYRIALNEGIDLEAWGRLKAALDTLVIYYKNKSTVPKKLAASFIDLTPLFERSIDRYNDHDQEIIEDIRDEIVSLAEDIFFDE